MHLWVPALFWTAFAGLAACIGYLLLLTGASFFAGAGPKALAGRRLRFAILVPAFNEEGVLGGLLQSLWRLDYPEDCRHVFVVADHCTDATASVACRGGARVYERTNAERQGKGYALQWLLEQIAAREGAFDAFVVFDADSRVDPSFLQAMETELGRGYQALQGHYAVLNPGDGNGAALRAGAMALVNFVRPLGKNALGCSTGLKGNGMCFSAAVIERYGWNTHSLAEDAEYGVRLLLDGIGVRFVPAARVWAQMPPQVRQSGSQNLRWEAGRLMVARRYAAELLKAGLRRRSGVLVEAAIDVWVPPLSVLVGGIAALGIATLARDLAHAQLAVALLAFGLAAHVLLGLAHARVPASVWRALLTAPAYSLWKLFLYGKALLRRAPSEWVKTRRF